MKVSVNWMQELAGSVAIMPAGGIDDLVQKIGAQLGAVEGVEALGEKYKGILIARVVSCDKHPDADKLSVCKIDDGGKITGLERDANGHIQVVCGAPNVREGLLVAWLPPGATVPNSYDKEPFVLEARELRGQISNGMLASAHELALSEDHTGIVELDPEDAQPGDDFASTYKLDDYIIDIENKMFTHRPDCFGMLGVAREIAGITGQKFTSPEIYALQQTVTNDPAALPVVIKNELPELVPRFMVQVYENVTVGPSPFWLQTYLARIGLRPINNIVDLTNYFMIQTGQPMHAYDYDKVKSLSQGEATIVVRHPLADEKLKLLNGKEIQLRSEAITIATDKQAIGIGGVMGGSETEVDNTTTRIILECANFDMYSIRRTSMEHGLFTDAVTRFSKGQSALQCDRVLAWTQGILVKLSGATPGNVYDDHAELLAPLTVTSTTQFINDRLGSKLSAIQMAGLLMNVEFAVDVHDEEIICTPPFWRTDIEIPEDIVEEVGRLHGYDRLPATLPLRTMKATPRNSQFDFKSRIRQILSAAGANEVLTYSFVHGDLLQKVGQNPKEAFRLTNALSPDLQFYRVSLLPSLLDKVYPNIKAGAGEVALFEMSATHNKAAHKAGELPDEVHSLSLIYAADDKAGNASGAAYFQARKYLTSLFNSLGIKPAFGIINTDPGYPIIRPFELSRSALVTDSATGAVLGVVGELKAPVRRNLKLPIRSAGFELSLDGLLASSASQKQYVTLPKFPSVQQDISLRVPTNVSYQQLYDLVFQELEARKPSNTRINLSPVDIYQAEADPQRKHVTLRLALAAYDRTLKAEEVNSLLDEVAAVAHEKFDAERL